MNTPNCKPRDARLQTAPPLRSRAGKPLALAIAAIVLAGFMLPGTAQNAPSGSAATEADAADVQALTRELEALKSSYASEVRRLRELDMRVQALQARLGGKVAPGNTAPPAVAEPASPAANAERETYAGTQEQAKRSIKPQRSVEDVLQQEHALFNRPLTLEAGITYGHYDRRQLTLNGFLALDAIFLGNIAVEGVKSDSLTYHFAARYGVTPRLTLNLDVPFIERWTNYQKGGAGGAAAALAEEYTHDPPHLGDVNASANFRLLAETASRPDVVLTAGVVAPTGRSPYGTDVRIIERDDDDFIRFAVPSRQATGNGLWAVNLGASAVKTMDPAIVFASFGYQHSFIRHFGDIDTSPDTITPGKVRLGDTFSFGAGVAFAFNDRTSMSLSFVDKIVREARIKIDGEDSQPVIGSLGNIGTLNLGVTYAMSKHLTWVALLGIGLTPDAPDFTLDLKVPYQF